jgi:hypothetical protein
MVEAAGIEHFAKLIKTIRYKSTMPKKCLKSSTLLAVPAMLVSVITEVGEGADS